MPDIHTGSYLFIRDASTDSAVIQAMLIHSGVNFQVFCSEPDDQSAPVLLGPDNIYSGIEDITRFVAQRHLHQQRHTSLQPVAS